MHEAESVADFMRSHVSERFTHHIVIEHDFPYTRIDGGGLGESPVVHQGNHVVEPVDIPYKDFTAARVHIARSGSVGYVGGNVSHAVVTDIVRVEARAVVRIVPCDYRILESGFLEGRLPVFDTLFYCFPPFVRESGIDVEDNRLLRFHEFAGEIFLHVLLFRFESPPVDDLPELDPVDV